VILYGGYSPERFELHNFDLLMKGSAIKSYVYRYFFTPPQKEDAKLLREIVDIAGRPEFRVPLARFLHHVMVRTKERYGWS
jgi:NADPH2:quinone reductase